MAKLLRRLLRILARRGWIVVLLVAIGVPASIWYALGRERVYEAWAVVQIEAPQIDDTGLGTMSGGAADRQLDLIEQKLMSRDSLLALAEEFELYGPAVPVVQQTDILRSSIQISKIVDPAAAYNPLAQPSGLTIGVRMTDPQLAADIANALLEQIIDEAQSRNLGRAARTLEFYRGEEARVGAAITAKEEELARFKEAWSDSLPEALASQRARLDRLEESRRDFDSQIIELQSGSDRLREEELARQTALLEQQRDLVDASIAEVAEAIAAAPEVERQLLAITREMELLQTEYTAITQRRTDAALNNEIEAQDNAARYEVLERAVPPYAPVTASRKKLALAGGAASLIAGLALAFVLELMSPALRSAEQVERQLGVQPVVVIPVISRQGPGRLLRRGGVLAVAVGLALGAWALLRTTGASLVPGRG
ncbi:chain-length determining protein [Pseudoroseicyclus sp. CXY001]|uniref:chain-length determining protein n=1 Tax=Pseudoroseicyclus sp. CXY001 TaxID=3242492 RepID=UPI003570B97C